MTKAPVGTSARAGRGVPSAEPEAEVSRAQAATGSWRPSANRCSTATGSRSALGEGGWGGLVGLGREARAGGGSQAHAPRRRRRPDRPRSAGGGPLNHPGIVGLYELAADDDDLYLVSELVRGRTLADLERERALSDRDVARIGAALCEALEHAHARGVIHRDVKPQNVMVVAEPAAGAGFAKLTDFGVASRRQRRPRHAHGSRRGDARVHGPRAGGGPRGHAGERRCTPWRSRSTRPGPGRTRCAAAGPPRPPRR